VGEEGETMPRAFRLISISFLSGWLWATEPQAMTLTETSSLNVYDEHGDSSINQYQHLQDVLSRTGLDSRAEALIRASETYTRIIMTLPELSRVNSATYVDAQGDCFVVEWRFSDGGRPGTAILQDTPLYSKYAPRFTSLQLSGKDQRSSFLLALLPPMKAPMWLGGLNVAYTISRGSINSFSARPSVPLSAFPVAREFEAQGVEAGEPGELYISLTVGKSLLDLTILCHLLLPSEFPDFQIW
jgi:hypothetical protein